MLFSKKEDKPKFYKHTIDLIIKMDNAFSFNYSFLVENTNSTFSELDVINSINIHRFFFNKETGFFVSAVNLKEFKIVSIKTVEKA